MSDERRSRIHLDDHFHALDYENYQTINHGPREPADFDILRVGSVFSQNKGRSDSYSDDINAPPRQHNDDPVVAETQYCNPQELSEEPEEFDRIQFEYYRQNPHEFNGLRSINLLPSNTLFGALQPLTAFKEGLTLTGFSSPPDPPLTGQQETVTYTTEERQSSYGFPHQSAPQSFSTGNDLAASQYTENGDTPYAVSATDGGAFQDGQYFSYTEFLHMPSIQQAPVFTPSGNAIVPGGLATMDDYTMSGLANTQHVAQSEAIHVETSSSNSSPMNFGLESFDPMYQLYQHAPSRDADDDQLRLIWLVIADLKSRNVVGQVDSQISTAQEQLANAVLKLSSMRGEAVRSDKRKRCIYCSKAFCDDSTRTRHESITHLGIRFACTNPNCTDTFEQTKDRPERLKKHLRTCRNHALERLPRDFYKPVTSFDRIRLGDNWPSEGQMRIHFRRFGLHLMTFEDVLANRV